VREVLEESGFSTRAVKLIGLYDRDRHAYRPHLWHIWKAVFLCELIDEEQKALGTETTAARYFAKDELPSLQLSRASEWHLERCFAHRTRPELPTDVD